MGRLINDLILELIQGRLFLMDLLVYRMIKNIEGKQILSFKKMTDCHKLNTVQGKTMNSLII